MNGRLLIAALLISSSVVFAQSRLPVDWLKGFTRSSDEHIINENEEKITVVSVQGVILDPSLAPLRDAIFEIRGPGKLEHIRGVKTDKSERFSMRNVPNGTYMYKATMDGFQSEVGTIIVSKDANRRNRISVNLHVGV